MLENILFLFGRYDSSILRIYVIAKKYFILFFVYVLIRYCWDAYRVCCRCCVTNIVYIQLIWKKNIGFYFEIGIWSNPFKTRFSVDSLSYRVTLSFQFLFISSHKLNLKLYLYFYFSFMGFVWYKVYKDDAEAVK